MKITSVDIMASVMQMIEIVMINHFNVMETINLMNKLKW